MENTNYVGLSYQMALQSKMDTIANNIANVDTSGYKSSHIQFNEYVVEAKRQAPMSMVVDVGQYKNFEAGKMTQTGNPLDAAIQGNGFFAVETPEGEKFTRNGNFLLNGMGQIVTSFGQPVLDQGGSPITIPADAQSITISENGTVATDQGQIGRLKVVRFENPQDLKPIGNTLYETNQDGIQDDTSRVFQGAVEGSNVNAVMEMTDMIEVLRKYQSMARLLQNEHDLQSNMISKLSRF